MSNGYDLVKSERPKKKGGGGKEHEEKKSNGKDKGQDRNL
jgi:hypothetical protein